MKKKIFIMLGIICFGVACVYTDSIATERFIHIPIDSRVEKVGDFWSLKLPDGSKAEIRRILIYDNHPIRDNILGECVVKFLDKDGRVQEGIGYIIMNPAEGKLMRNKVKIPVRIRFIPR